MSLNFWLEIARITNRKCRWRDPGPEPGCCYRASSPSTRPHGNDIEPLLRLLEVNESEEEYFKFSFDVDEFARHVQSSRAKQHH
jgi:hypothetical protein